MGKNRIKRLADFSEKIAVAGFVIVIFGYKTLSTCDLIYAAVGAALFLLVSFIGTMEEEE